MPNSSDAYAAAHQTTATYGRKVSLVVFGALKVRMTHHNFVQRLIRWVHPEINACLEGYDSRESAWQGPGSAMKQSK